MVNEYIDSRTDIDLYNRFLLGDKDAFNILIARYRKELTKFIQYYVKDFEIAEDIAQDSFLYMIIYKKDYNFKYSFRTYLYTIAKSRAINYLRKEKQKVSLEDINFEDFVSSISIEEDIIKKYDRDKLKYAINKLKKEYQIIISLYYFQNFKYKEISEILNISMPKTKMSINRAKKRIKKILEEEYNYEE